MVEKSNIEKALSKSKVIPVIIIDDDKEKTRDFDRMVIWKGNNLSNVTTYLLGRL